MILALDLATTLGWATFDDQSGELLHGIYKLRSQRKGKADPRLRIVSLEDWLPRVLPEVAWGAGEVVVEGTVGAYHDSLVVGSALQAVTRSMCASFGIDTLAEIPPTTVKLFATGKGNADKDEVLAAVKARWSPDVHDDNEADAVALLYCHLGAK